MENLLEKNFMQIFIFIKIVANLDGVDKPKNFYINAVFKKAQKKAQIKEYCKLFDFVNSYNFTTI